MRYTPNCSNVCLKNEKKDKAKLELRRLIKPHSQSGFISQPLHFSAGVFFLIVFHGVKTIANQFQQANTTSMCGWK